jgi:toxin ParE1/3/4
MIKYAPGVFDELTEITLYMAQFDETVATRFLDSCESSFERLKNFPDIGAPQKLDDPRLAEVRMWLVKDFDNYLIFYPPLNDGVRILHVLHSALDFNRIFEPGDP